MPEHTEIVTVVTAGPGGGFGISVADAQLIDAAFEKTGKERLVWVTANPGTTRAVRIRLNIDQVVYIANATP